MESLGNPSFILRGYMFERYSKNILTCLVGLGATAIGVAIGSFFNDNETIEELHDYLDKEQYIQYLVSSFIKKDEFIELFKYAVLSIIFMIAFALAFAGFTLVKLKKQDKTTALKLENIHEKISNIEHVIESILRDHENIDIEQLKFFKSEIDQQRITFKNLISNKTLELETKISAATSVCSKAKTQVQTDLKNAKDMICHSDYLKNELNAIQQTLNNVKLKSQTIETDMTELYDSISEKRTFIEQEFKEKFTSLNEKLNSQYVDIHKCNNLLLDSQIMLEAAVIEFEKVSNPTDIAKSSNITERTILCLRKALEVKSYYETGTETENLCSSSMITELPFTSGNIETDPNKNSVNASLIKIMSHVSDIEERLDVQEVLIKKNCSDLKNSLNLTATKVSDIKAYSDEWITSWIAVLYALFNSTFMNLEDQLFGIDYMEYKTIFQFESNKSNENSNLLQDIVEKCKKTCLKTINEVNLLIFEYYLVQKSSPECGSSLVSLCEAKIDEELEDLFESIKIALGRSSITEPQKSNILNTLHKLKQDLVSDLKCDTRRYNSLVKQNLKDFHLIHDTIKTLFTKPEHKGLSLSEDESVIEVSDNSISLISENINSSYSEDDSSFLNEGLSGSSLRPFKITTSLKTKGNLLRG
ncbi:hypothetical protein CAS74_000391 [Pichia kudriavzevii]|uniref:Uncharacterized protein n=1 Tax=Pichia kudriavzevii TaxID=4909 RepID=A0A1Z8JTV4_PICKU|nr:hypothetical protein CAS74_000391 [Pichia kudriavzevii]